MSVFIFTPQPSPHHPALFFVFPADTPTAIAPTKTVYVALQSAVGIWVAPSHRFFTRARARAIASLSSLTWAIEKASQISSAESVRLCINADDFFRFLPTIAGSLAFVWVFAVSLHGVRCFTCLGGFLVQVERGQALQKLLLGQLLRLRHHYTYPARGIIKVSASRPG